MAVHPEVLWAQRSSKSEPEKVRILPLTFDRDHNSNRRLSSTPQKYQNIVYMTVNLPDIIESTLEYKLTPTNISVKAKAGKYVLSGCHLQARLL
jgi:hypothetical protein